MTNLNSYDILHHMKPELRLVVNNQDKKTEDQTTNHVVGLGMVHYCEGCQEIVRTMSKEMPGFCVKCAEPVRGVN